MKYELFRTGLYILEAEGQLQLPYGVAPHEIEGK